MPALGVISLSAILAGSCVAEPSAPERTLPSKLTYLPIGDSYTVGEGVKVEERFPNQLRELLRAKGVTVDLIGNPAQTGFATDLVLRKELPVLQEARPSFVTILTGVNDWVRGYSDKTFRTYLRRLLEESKIALSGPKLMVVLSIPDFSRTRVGPVFARGRNITAGIAEFNGIIREESARVDAKFVDLSDLDDEVESDPSLTTADGLHPAGPLYRKWAERIASTLIK